MIFGAEIDDALVVLRGYEQERHGCRCEVRKLTGRKAQNPANGRELPTYVVVHADVPCRLPASTRATTESNSGGARRAEVDREIHVSADLPLLKYGWFIVVTSVDANTNPGLVGQVFRVTDPMPADQVTARRVGVTGEGVPMEMVLDAAA